MNICRIYSKFYVRNEAWTINETMHTQSLTFRQKKKRCYCCYTCNWNSSAFNHLVYLRVNVCGSFVFDSMSIVCQNEHKEWSVFVFFFRAVFTSGKPSLLSVQREKEKGTSKVFNIENNVIQHESPQTSTKAASVCADGVRKNYFFSLFCTYICQTLKSGFDWRRKSKMMNFVFIDIFFHLCNADHCELFWDLDNVSPMASATVYTTRLSGCS